jgi:acyl-coenzyme A synthetase/AMP-(fatty) acid ligase
LSRELAGRLRPLVKELWNLYGPTETTVWSTACRVEDGAGAVPIGRPIANTRVYVLDARLRPVPFGVAGDLYIGGAGVARGYHGRLDLTAERFIPDPLTPGGRLYNTGDRARFRPDGQIEYLGRADDQVKVRGFRIELGEVEAALGAHPQVGQAVAAVTDDAKGDRRLVAYFTPSDTSAPTGTELRRFLRGRLPDYMVPSLFVEIDRVPLTPNGKIDRRSLPDPFADTGSRGGPDAPPCTPVQLAVASIWCDALKTAHVGLSDNFFDLGGHSLLAMQVLARIERELGRRPGPRVMVLGTLEQVAAACEDDGYATAAPPRLRIT